MYRERLAQLEALTDSLEDIESKTDAEALLRVDLANALARCAAILRALAADEGETK